jgi:hypothetical protein
MIFDKLKDTRWEGRYAAPHLGDFFGFRIFSMIEWSEKKVYETEVAIKSADIKIPKTESDDSLSI